MAAQQAPARPAKWKGFVEGGLAAMIAGSVTHPLDLIKVRMQLQQAAAAAVPQPALATAGGGSIALPLPPAPAARLGPIGTGLKVIQTEGALALFNGVSASCLRQGVYSSTRLGIYDLLKQAWEEPPAQGVGGKPTMALHKKVAAGLISGAIGSFIGNPADVAMVRMQADGRLPHELRRNYRHAGDAIVRIAKQEGPLALWRGCGPTVQRAMVVTASQLATYDQAKEGILVSGLARDGFGVHVAASFTAGIVASVTSNPLDVVKTRLMDMKLEAGKPPPYTGALDCAVKTVRAEGAFALYKGFIPTVTRQGPFTVVLFVSLEQIRKLMAPL